MPAILFAAASCDSFVEVGPPASQLTGAAVFEDPATADAALSAIYAGLRDEGILSGSVAGGSCILGAYADELVAVPNESLPPPRFYANALLSSNATVQAVWVAAYGQVYKANAVIQGVSAATGLAQPQRDRLLGEAFFLRALLHAYLVELYGDVPFVETTDYRVNATLHRLPVGVVRDRIAADLEQAVALLPQEYAAPGRARANRAAAYALLARTYLYAGRWQEASDAASAVLNDPQYAMEPLLANVFLKDSPETILQLPPAPEGNPVTETSTFVLLAAPPSVVALAPGLVASFDPADGRPSAWTGSVSDGTDTWFFPYKYKQVGIEAVSSEYSVLLRLAEVFLVRAEARARAGELVGARADLDVVRQRAGLLPSGAVSQDQLLAAILEERRHELFAEHGHRFFDLKRFGVIDAVLGPVKPGWDPADALFPLPASELAANPNLLPQNPGY
jgi:hypothetical protein